MRIFSVAEAAQNLAEHVTALRKAGIDPNLVPLVTTDDGDAVLTVPFYTFIGEITQDGELLVQLDRAALPFTHEAVGDGRLVVVIAGA